MTPFGPKQLVDYAVSAEHVGFDFEVSATTTHHGSRRTDIALVQVGDEGQDRLLKEAAQPLLGNLRSAAP